MAWCYPADRNILRTRAWNGPAGRLRARLGRRSAHLAGREHCRLHGHAHRPRGERLPQRDLSRAGRPLHPSSPPDLRREAGRLPALVAGRARARLCLEPGRRLLAAVRPPASRRRGEAPDQHEGERARAGVVAGRHAARIRRAHARSAVRGRGRREARAAPLHAPLLQVRRRGLDGRPQAAGLRRRLRRLDGTVPAHGGRLRGHVPDLVSRQRVDRVLVCARRRLGHEDLLRSLRGGRRRGRAAQITGSDGQCAFPAWSPDGALLAFLYVPGIFDDPRHAQITVVPAKGGEQRILSASLDRNCNPYPPDPRSGLGRRRDRVRGRGSRQQRPVPRLCGRLQLRRDPPRDRCHGTSTRQAATSSTRLPLRRRSPSSTWQASRSRS